MPVYLFEAAMSRFKQAAKTLRIPLLPGLEVFTLVKTSESKILRIFEK